MIVSTLLITVLSLLAGPQEPLQAPDGEDLPRTLASQRRLVQAYGFEEAERFPTKLPGPFFRENGRPDHPNFGSVEVDNQVAYAGRWSLRFDVNGGSIAVALPPAEVPIFPQSRYLVTARVRTEGLSHSGARLTVRLHDTAGRPIPGTERRTEPIRTHGEWTKLTIETPVDVPNAADLVFELQLEQPSADVDLMPRRVDVSGKAWFDEIMIWQRPRIEFHAEPAVGVTRLPETPRLVATLRDLARGDVSAAMRVRDVDGVVRLEEDLDLKDGRAELAMDLAGLPKGWYLGEFEVHDSGVLVARAEQPMAILSQRAPKRLGQGEPFFGITLGGLGQDVIERRCGFLEALQPDYAVLPIWESNRPARLSTSQAEQTEEVLDILLDARIEPVFELAGVPSDMQQEEHLDADQVIALLLTRPDVMEEGLRPWMLQFGDEVSRWRVRSEVDRLDDASVRMLGELARYADEYVAVPSMEVTGVHAQYPGKARSAVDALVLAIPSEVPTDSLEELLLNGEQDGRIVQLMPSESVQMSPRRRAEDFARRLVEAWAAGVPMVESTPLWRDDFQSEHLENRTPPGLDSTGFVFHALTRFLSGRPAEAEVPLGRGVRAVLAGGSGRPLLVVWSEHPSASFELGFGAQGDEIRVHDVLGGSFVLTPSVGAPRVSLGPAPLFIEGVDRDLARFRADASIVPPTIDPSIGLHELALVVTNPWSEMVELRVRPVGPASWTFQPRTRHVSVAPGAEVAVPFEFTYPRAQVDGKMDFWFDVRIVDAKPRDVQLLMPSRIHSDKVTVDTEWRVAHDESGRPTGLVVTVEAHNIGSEPLSLEAFTAAHGFLRMTKSMPELPPGGVAARTFILEDGQNRLRGQDLLVGVSEFGGDMRISRRIRIPVSTGSIVGADPSAQE